MPLLISISLPIFKVTSALTQQSHDFFCKNSFSCLVYKRFACDPNKWKSPLIPKYGVEIVLTVDQQGCGQFNSVQNAVDAVPDDHASSPTLIILDSGTYTEKVVVKNTKSHLIIEGQGYDNTFIAWDDTASRSNGTFHSYSVGVFASNFIAYDISFKPRPGAVGGQAVALRIGGDQAAFYNCGFYGFQDTLHDDQGRHYFKNCFIQGSIDFIFGNATSLYQDCNLNLVARGGSGINGGIAAQRRESSNVKSGFSFVNCRIEGTGKVFLGRAWGAYSTTVYINTFMSQVITPEGWGDYGDPSRQQTVFYGEHACSGPGSDFSSRVNYAKQLSEADAAPFMDISYIDGQDWLHPDFMKI
ncbi:hypothetical protein QVD17_14719 [Tagetes erecta]|uniref:Pectinesterase n=1 Tax=Tagetes erecta TaxID=13708 RepID=A0AAD8KRV5_TARER|nr:hypothetical protein QVD17_14719 [Tagetes erecta]